MTDFSRRSVMKGAVAATAALTVPGVAWAAEPHLGVIVIDGRFAPSAAAALKRSARGPVVVDAREEDLGIAWRKRIPALLQNQGAILSGVTLWSDFVICQTFAHQHGLALVRSSEALGSMGGLFHWEFAASGHRTGPVQT